MNNNNNLFPGSLYEDMEDDLQGQVLISKSHFYFIWRTEVKGIKIPKVRISLVVKFVK